MSGLTFAIGDIHGRLDLLEGAEAAVAARADGAAHKVICLGDYVDRGPDSKGVVERLMARAGDSGWICLKGNHEAMMAQALNGGRRIDFAHWMQNGGDRTLESYGCEVAPEHLAWLESRPLTHREGRRLFVHAGIDPTAPLEDQGEGTLLWIREKFLAAPRLAWHVVHGHTPFWRGKPDPAEPEVLPQRTNLDTGACFTGILSIGVFEPGAGDGPVEILSAVGPPSDP
jgi:serine/threonine protein phosphatase 1